jgi:hypothetical protein
MVKQINVGSVEPHRTATTLRQVTDINNFGFVVVCCRKYYVAWVKVIVA